MNKLLTIAIPVFNGEETIRACLDSLLAFLEQLEVVVVDDGSEDDTSRILDHYTKQYPDHIRLVSKERGGPGSAVNLAMDVSQAPFFKTLDADDSLEEEGLEQLLHLIREVGDDNSQPEMLVSDFYYLLPDDEETFRRVRASYANVFPGAGATSWSRMKNFRVDQLLSKVSITYSRRLLDKINLHLPEHQLFADQLYAYEPLPHVRRICYLDRPVYNYRLGRQGQTGHLPTMLDHIKELQLMTLEMFRRVRLDSVRPQRLQRYMYTHMSRMISACMMLFRAETDGQAETMKQMELFWQELGKINAPATRKLRNLPILNTKRLMKASGTYLHSQVYNLIGRVFILD